MSAPVSSISHLSLLCLLCSCSALLCPALPCSALLCQFCFHCSALSAQSCLRVFCQLCSALSTRLPTFCPHIHVPLLYCTVSSTLSHSLPANISITPLLSPAVLFLLSLLSRIRLPIMSHSLLPPSAPFHFHLTVAPFLPVPSLLSCPFAVIFHIVELTISHIFRGKSKTCGMLKIARKDQI